MAEKSTENKMREIKIEKIVLNIGVGEPGEKLENAKTILERTTGRKPVYRKTKKRTTFGVAKGRDIGVMVTVRDTRHNPKTKGNKLSVTPREEAKELLSKLIKAKEDKLEKRCFSGRTFSFGIPEYIKIPGAEYDPKIQIFGLDVCVTLRRPGFGKTKIGKKHQISSEEAVKFIKDNFEVEIV
jgi:large subunit ribosomal protein L5